MARRIVRFVAIAFAVLLVVDEVAPAQVPTSEWHVRGWIWQSRLPTRLTGDEMVAVYGDCMFFGEGRGVSFGAKRFYGKQPSDLTTAEAIGLVAIFRQPSASPVRNENRFREMVTRLERHYRLTANAPSP